MTNYTGVVHEPDIGGLPFPLRGNIDGRFMGRRQVKGNWRPDGEWRGLKTGARWSTYPFVASTSGGLLAPAEAVPNHACSHGNFRALCDFGGR